MKASELRIGNWVKYNFGNNNGTVIATTGGRGSELERVSINVSDNSWFTSVANELEPIPLTEEWLIKFGFDKIKEHTFSAPDVSFLIYTNQKKYSVSFWQGNELEYVHQLQNLYFALTGEELTIKE